MKKRNRSNKNTSLSTNKYLLTGVAVSSALVMARPIIPSIVYAADANKYNWAKQDLNLIGGESSSRAASSASGSNLIAGSWSYGENPTQPYPLYVSSNYGASWRNVTIDDVDPETETFDSDVANMWSSVDVSNDGQTMVAASTYGIDLTDDNHEVTGKVILSKDAGNSWLDITPDDVMSGGESKVVVSGDGDTIATSAGNYMGLVYITKDDGASWEPASYIDLDADEHNVIGSISISDNGNKLLIGGESGSGAEYNNLFISEDGGTSWVDIDPDEVVDRLIVPKTAMTADGSKIVVSGVSMGAGGENDYIFVSNNDGADWDNVTPDDDAWNIWTSVDISDDGKTIAATDVDYFGGETFSTRVSSDSGASWNLENVDEADPGSKFDFYFKSSVDLNSDGSRAIIGRVGGVYVGEMKPAPTPSPAASSAVRLTDPYGGKVVSLKTPDGTNITCSSTAKEAALTAQDSAYSYPLGFVEFCFDTEAQNNEVSLTYVTNLKPDQVKARKFNSNSKDYYDVPNASITQTTFEGQPALQLTYAITDNGLLDLNSAIGSIKDPVGLAAVAGELADTGQAQTALLLLAGLSSLTAAGYLIARRKDFRF